MKGSSEFVVNFNTASKFCATVVTFANSHMSYFVSSSASRKSIRTTVASLNDKSLWMYRLVLGTTLQRSGSIKLIGLSIIAVPSIILVANIGAAQDTASATPPSNQISRRMTSPHLDVASPAKLSHVFPILINGVNDIDITSLFTKHEAAGVPNAAVTRWWISWDCTRDILTSQQSDENNVAISNSLLSSSESSENVWVALTKRLWHPLTIRQCVQNPRPKQSLPLLLH